MPRIKYSEYRPNAEARQLIATCSEILDDYELLGYKLTLRQLYYQLVARDIIENSQKSYKRLGEIVSRAREAGMIDWNQIEDRTRRLQSKPHWEDGKDFLESVAPQFNLDLWKGQSVRMMVFVEKEALAQIVEMACRPYDVPFLSNKGYLSASAAWTVGHDHILTHECDRWVILHLGDHDPSGVDMTRDIRERVQTFASRYEEDQAQQKIQIKRIALTMDQVERYNPPPNPAKVTDARFGAYAEQYGDECWELDALQPQVITDLIRDNIRRLLDMKKFKAREKLQTSIRNRLIELAAEAE